MVLKFEESEHAIASADSSCDNYANIVQQRWIVIAHDAQRTHEIGQSLIDMDEAKGE
jgi:hypothetical protein